MGYTTYFSGSVTVEPPLNEDEISFLQDFNQTRRMSRTGGPLFVKGNDPMGQGVTDEVLDHNSPPSDQPGLWCQWVPTEDGLEIEWDEGEKFYNATEWMEYIVNKLLSPAAKPYIQQHLAEDERLKNFTCDHVVNGEIHADGEESDDNWKVKVTNNVVEQIEAVTRYLDEEPEAVPPSESELKEALKSLGAKTTALVKVWTLTVDPDSMDSIATTVHASEQEVYESLRQNYASELPEGTPTDVLIEELEEQGLVWYMDLHAVEVEV